MNNIKKFGYCILYPCIFIQKHLLISIIIIFILLSSIFLVLNSREANADITTDLVGYWKFDDGVGITATDSSGNGNDGTLTNGPTWTTGQVDGALSFDGSNDYVDCGNNASLDFDTNLTISIWFNLTNTIDSDFVGKDVLISRATSASSSDNDWSLAFNDDDNGRLRFGTFGDNIQTATASWIGGNWYQVSIVQISSTEGYVYVNGVEDNYNSDYNPGGINGVLNNILTIGRNIAPAETNYFNGLIDEVRVHNRALSAAEITELYNYTGPTQTCAEAGGTCKTNQCTNYIDCASISGTCTTGYCCGDASLPVFPSAEGFGTDTRAAYGLVGVNPTIYRINTLSGSSVGPTAVGDGTYYASLRTACAQSGPRIIIFETSGTITLNNALYLRNPYLAILGQTAPFPGIQIAGNSIKLQTHDVLIQHLRFRPNLYSDINLDCLWIFDEGNEGDVYDIVVDHCTMMYGSDENFGIYPSGGLPPLSHDITLSNNIIAEGICDGPPCSTSEHRMSLLIFAKNMTIAKNLVMSNNQRNPHVKQGTEIAYVNNFNYNIQYAQVSWDSRVDPTHGPAKGSIVGNVFEDGPSSWNSAGYVLRMNFAWSCQQGDKVYFNDNIAPKITGSDQWEGIYWKCSVPIEDVKVLSPPVTISNLNIIDSENVKSHITTNAGAWPNKRDSTEKRLISESLSGGTQGSLKAGVQILPVYAENTNTLAIPANPHADDDSDGYTNLEEWLHCFSCDVEGRVCPGCGTDTTPPMLSNPSPTGALPAGTTQTTISLTTNETATCKYSTTPNTAYASITNTFSTTGGTSHSQTITGLSNGNTYNYYVRCLDEAGNPNIDDFNISFSIASPTPTTYNILNFAQLVIDWLATAVSTADLNNDGVVNTRDLGIMMSNWEE